MAEAPSGVVAQVVSCRDEIPPGGEGQQRADILLANAHFRAIIRHPLDAKTVPDVSGGTLVDAAPWGWRDRLHEAIPVVGGGWMEVEEWTLLEDGVWLGGWVRDLPHQPASDWGAWREVSWHIAEDEPYLQLTGADGLYLHGTGELPPRGEVLSGPVSFWAEQPITEDLGGAVQLEGVERLWVHHDGMMPELIADIRGGQDVEIRAEGADKLWLYRGDQLAFVLPFSGADLLRVPDDISHVMALGAGLGSSSKLPISPSMTLDLGQPGDFTVYPLFDNELPHHPVWLTWSSADGRNGSRLVPPEGALFNLGSGRFTLEATAGPEYGAATRVVEVAPGGSVSLALSLSRELHPTRSARLGLDWHGDRDRFHRELNDKVGDRAAAEGLAYAVLFATDDLDSSDTDRVRMDSGIQSYGEGWRLRAWPLKTSKDANHGAPSLRWASAETAIDRLAAQSNEHSVEADLAWLSSVSPTYPLQPDLVALDAPEANFDNWEPWFAWLDAKRAIVPTGPLTWTGVNDPRHPTRAEQLRAIKVGDVTAGSTGLMTVSIDDQPPGAVIERGLRPLRVSVDVQGLDQPEVTVISGRHRWTTTTGTFELSGPLASWVVVVAQDDEDWLASAPFWVDGVGPRVRPHP